MNNEYIIISKTAIQKIDELVKEANAGKTISFINSQMAESLIRFKEQLLSQSTPLIPEIEKAFAAGERYGWDSQKSIGNIDEMREKIKLQSLDNYISKLKLDI